MNEFLNEDVIGEAKNVNDDVVKDVGIYADEDAKDEDEGHDEVVVDVAVLLDDDDDDVEIDVESVKDDVDVMMKL